LTSATKIERPWAGNGNWPRPAMWVAVAVVALSVILLRWEGRIWWCECRQLRVWIGDVWTSHCSQHLFDPYSLTHISHGLIFYTLLAIFARRWPVGWRLCVAIGVAAGWEVLENSPLIINRYRTQTMSLDYLGDSVVNSLGDILSCVIGFFIARWIGLWKTILVFLATELLLLFLIRDGLVLGTLMLIKPIESIKAWQTAGRAKSTGDT
jgi:hypothetical protein